jgi:hypothetical protein
MIISWCLPYPYSEHYTLRGWISHTIYDNGDSIVSFVPTGGARTLSHVHTFADDYSKEDEHQIFHVKAPALVKHFQNTSKPYFLQHLGKVNVLKLDENEKIQIYRLTLFDPENETDFLGVFIQCPEGMCIDSVTNQPDLNLFECLGKLNCFRLKISPVHNGTFIDIGLVKGQKIPVDVIVNYNNHTKEIEDFYRTVPKYVINTMGSSAYADTILVSHHDLG